VKNNDQILLEQAYNRIYESIDAQSYYDDLNSFLAKNYPHPNPTLKIGKNLTNPDLGYVDPNQMGIFDTDTGKQIGKLQVTIGDGVITLDNIKAFKSPTQGPRYEEDDEVVKQKSYGLGEKVLRHLNEYASNNNLDVQAEIVNPILKKKFDRIFKFWNVSSEGNMVKATNANDATDDDNEYEQDEVERQQRMRDY
jgi:hypothetical protein